MYNDKSRICQYGRSKEKRSDCKVVVLAAVVNTEGLLVRTSIYEGNRHDSTTLEEVIGSVSNDLVSDAKRIVEWMPDSIPQATSSGLQIMASTYI